MTLLQLQYFKTLARVLHYTHAAKELHIAQPSLSYSISELEKELGVKLFNKENRIVSLTVYGEQFLPYAEKALALLDEGADVLHQLAGTALQVVNLGYFHSISSSLIPSIMAEVYSREENRGIRFQFLEAPSFDIFTQLKSGALDLAFCMHLDDSIESVTIMRQPLYLAVPANHPLAGKSSVTFEQFAREPMVMLDKPSNLRTLVDQVFAKRGVPPIVMFEVRECNAALQYVALRFGVSILPQVPAMENAKVSIIPIEDSEQAFVRTVYLSWAKNHPLSPATRRIKDYIIERYATPSDS
ncbi:LysR family transcriptional regulator [Oscillibacter sp.]|uniref:LysR family transcriptional regulator n=1 Tax=Oscillibacter sp. TaxID=1945593 RepID=UPI00289BD721|nr:LysR family transcriptional regulator [Oscillibacter sp.]